jgi:hypothetical protein
MNMQEFDGATTFSSKLTLPDMNGPICMAAASLLCALAASPVRAQPIVLVCTEEAGGSQEAQDSRFFVLIEFDEDSVTIHGRDYPPLSVLLVRPWVVQFADNKTSPVYLGSIDRITGELIIETAGSPPQGKPSGLLEAACELTSRLF